MPLNLMTLTKVGNKGPIHVNPANVASVEPAEGGGSLVTLSTGKEHRVIDDHQRVVKVANARAPDGF